jgi:hypothetical protein
MKRLDRTAALYLSLTFLSGAAVGWLGYWFYSAKTVTASSTRASDHYRKRYLDEMESRLKLTAEQKERLVTILDQTRILYREVYEKHRPELEAIQQHQTSQIRAILSPEQQQEYEKIRAEREARRKKGPPPF